MDHLEKLQKYQEKIRELHKLSNESGVKTDIVAFDHVEIKLPEDAIITTTWYNDTNRVTKTNTFPLSMIEDFTGRIVEKIKYRKKIIDGKMGFVEGEKEK